MSERDYYEVLGLTSGADGTAVNRTYWHLARKYQALATSDPRAHSMLDELNEAYNVLGTPALRDEYDANRPDGDHPSGNEREKSSAVRSGHSWRAPEPARSPVLSPSHGPIVVRSWMAYALGAAFTVAGAGAGLWSGNLVLEMLAGCGALAIAAAAARDTLLGARHADGALRTGETSESDAPAASTRRRATAEPLSASIVRRRSATADDVRMSTASMVGRWRTKTNTAPDIKASEPDLTLVDIFRSEQEIETQSEPLSAVLDVLRGTRNPVESR